MSAFEMYSGVTTVQRFEVLMAVCSSGLWHCVVSKAVTSNYVLIWQHHRRHSIVQTFFTGLNA
jgi:hypothetical protein